MSQPRPPRRGGKVTSPSPASLPSDGAERPAGAIIADGVDGPSGSETRPTQATTTPKPNGEGGAKLPTPPEIDIGDSLLQFPTDAATHIAVGTVRARGAATALQKRDARAEKDAVERVVISAVAKALADGEAGKKEQRWAEKQPPLEQLEGCDVAIVSDAELLRTPIGIVRAHASARVLLVVPRHQLAKSVAAQLTHKCGVAATVGLWIGSTLQAPPQGVQILVTDQNTALLFFQTSRTLGPFSHVMLAKAHSQTLVYQVMYATLKQIMVHQTTTSKARSKLIISGFCHDAPQLVKYFLPLAAQVVVAETPSGAVTNLSQDEAFAFVEEQIPTIAVRGHDAHAAATCHPKIVDGAIDATLKIARRLLDLADGRPITVVVYTGDVGDTTHKLRKAFSSEENDKVVAVSTTLSVVAEECAGESRGSGASFRIAVLQHAANEGDAHDANVSVVIDHGTQRVFAAASPAEAALPTKQLQWQNRGEQALRKQSLGWRGPGLYIGLYGASDEKIFPEVPTPLMSIVPLDEGVLAAARNGVRINELAATLSTPIPRGAVEDAMHRLSEHTAIVAPDDAGITFMGELLSRVPLSFELATFVANATAVGLMEVGAAAAAIITIPLRTVPPRGMDRSTWLERVVNSRKKFRAGHNDILSDTRAYLAFLDAEDKKAFAAENGLDDELLNNVSDLARTVVDQLTDYAFPSQPTPAEMRAQLDASATVLTMLLAVALSRRTTIVRNEGSIGNAPPSGNLMFIRSSKDILANRNIHSNAEWKLGNAVVSATISNAFNRMFTSDSFSININYFFASMLLLHPCVDYSAPVTAGGKQSILFSTVNCRHTKRLRLDIGDGAAVLDFREKWKIALGCLQAKRSLPRGTTMAAFAVYLKQGRDQAVHLAQLQGDLRAQLVAIAAELDVAEHQATFTTFATHRLAPAVVGAELDAIAEASDAALAKKIAAGEFAAPATPGAAASTAAASSERRHATTANGASEPAAAAATGCGKFGLAGDGDDDDAAIMTFTSSNVPFDEDDDVEDEGGVWRSQGPILDDD